MNVQLQVRKFVVAEQIALKLSKPPEDLRHMWQLLLDKQPESTIMRVIRTTVALNCKCAVEVVTKMLSAAATTPIRCQ